MMDHKDKLLHKRIAQARTALRKVASALLESGDVRNAEYASDVESILSGWVEQIEKEGEKK